MPDCPICIKHEDAATQPAIVYRDSHWLVRHSSETNILGYFVVDAIRHVPDLSQMHPEEAASLGIVLRKLMLALRRVVDSERIYTFALGELVPHCHYHVVPRRCDLPRAFRGRGIMTYPLEPAADKALVEEVCLRVRRALADVSR